MEESSLRERVGKYAQERGFEIDFTGKLGFGSDGIVWPTDRRTAIKVFERAETYQTEKNCYLRLQARQVTDIYGFAVPQIEGYDDSLWVVEITIVSPPFLLDFGKAYLDRRPDYSEEVLAEDLSYRQDLFDERWPTVERLLNRLRSYGIYYVDARPGNITFE